MVDSLEPVQGIGEIQSEGVVIFTPIFNRGSVSHQLPIQLLVSSIRVLS